MCVLPVVACEEFKRGVVLACASSSLCRAPLQQLRAIMSVYQCDLYRRQANYLRRSAALLPSSVGALSCTHRLHVDEFRLLLSGSDPCVTGKEARTETLPVRRVGNMYHDREFADIVLRYLLQSGNRLTTPLNRFMCDMQLRGCVLGLMHPEHMKIAMGLRRYDTRIPRPAEGIVDCGVDDNTCVSLFAPSKVAFSIWQWYPVHGHGRTWPLGFVPLLPWATMFPDEVANKNTRKGKSRLRIFMAAAINSKNVLELYDMEIHQLISVPNCQKLKPW